MDDSQDEGYARVRVYDNGMFIFNGNDWKREVIIEEDEFQKRLFDKILTRLNSEWAHDQVYCSFIGFKAKMERMLDAANVLPGFWVVEEMRVTQLPPEEPGEFY